jgi:hypothetical protein
VKRTVVGTLFALASKCPCLSPFARKTEGIVGQPQSQWFLHRPISVVFESGFNAGFVVDGIGEPRLPRAEKYIRLDYD